MGNSVKSRRWRRRNALAENKHNEEKKGNLFIVLEHYHTNAQQIINKIEIIELLLFAKIFILN
jgi:hypothetical protein